MKLLVNLNSNKIEDYLNYTNSFIIGIKDLSINNYLFELKEVEELLNNYKIDLFISLNANYFNKDLELLEKTILSLSKMNIKGILFYDLAVLEIVKRNNLDIPLCWNQEHMVNNYNTCNYYYNKGCEYAYLTSDITKEEMMEISNNSKIKLITLFFGHPLVSFSKRELITNYFLFNNKKKEKEVYTIRNKDSEGYFINETDKGTRILTTEYLNGVKPFCYLRDVMEYGVLDEQLIDHDLFLKVLNVFKELNDKQIDEEEAHKRVFNLTGSDNTMFFDIKTIYKVKKDER